jgi:hypothetical protein
VVVEASQAIGLGGACIGTDRRAASAAAARDVMQAAREDSVGTAHAGAEALRGGLCSASLTSHLFNARKAQSARHKLARQLRDMRTR